MATFHVLYDPDDKITIGGHLPRAVKFAALRVDTLVPDNPEADAKIAQDLAALLLKNLTA